MSQSHFHSGFTFWASLQFKDCKVCWEITQGEPRWSWRILFKTLSHTWGLKNISGAPGSLLGFSNECQLYRSFKIGFLHPGNWSCLTWKLINAMTMGSMHFEFQWHYCKIIYPLTLNSDLMLRTSFGFWYSKNTSQLLYIFIKPCVKCIEKL